MIDLRPVGYVVGLLIAALGVAMLLPAGVDLFYGNENVWIFLESAAFTITVGGLLALACQNGLGGRTTLQQTFLMTTGVWIILPIFGAIPFWLAGISGATNAIFEATSGLTTTGATVLTGLQALPEGILLWRGLLQWFGGIGIIVFAMVFLPEMRVGGMQVFRTSGFGTYAKILPRAREIASRIFSIYLILTVACGLAYLAFGMQSLDAIVHAMTTVATGGFANYDSSFAVFSPGVEYTGALFMLLAALPFVRYVQLISGSAAPLARDTQVRVFLSIALIVVLALSFWLWATMGEQGEEGFRKSLFNGVSILTGTGYASADYMRWGAFPVVVIFFIGFIGGCAGSTTCSIKVFRYQILFSAIRTQVMKIHSPHGVFEPRFGGRPVSEDIVSSVMAFFVMFIVSLGVLAVALGMTGMDFISALSGSLAALANIGPGLGPQIGPVGNYQDINTVAKWLLIAGMLIGRLELMAVYVLLTVRFWRA